MSFNIKGIRNQHQRDLAALLLSPSLLNHHYEHPHPLAQHLDGQTEEMVIALINETSFENYKSTSQRLGHYAEDLIVYWLKHINNRDLHAGKQINDHNKRSVGEFDLLFKNNDQWQWWELCMKFYCLHEDAAELSQWIGPNSKDNLKRKYNHLFEQQLKLGDHPAAQPFLNEHHIHIHSRAAFFKGNLFKRPDQNIDQLHPAINPDTPIYWYTFTNTLELIPQQQTSSRYIRVPRMQWISPVILEPRTSGLLSYKHLLNELHQHPPAGPRLFVELSPDSDGWWCECNRGFVMPTDWPNITTD